MAKRAKTGTKKQIGIRVDTKLLDDVDKLARDLGLTRTQLVNRVLADLVTLGKSMGKGNLFSGLEHQLQEAMERAVTDAIQRGGLEDVFKHSQRISQQNKGKKAGK